MSKIYNKTIPSNTIISEKQINKSVKINYIYVSFCLFLSASILIAGYFLGDAIVFLFIAVFIFFFISKQYDNLVLLLIFWLYLSNFFVGQGWIKNNIISSYLIKGQLYVIGSFLFMVKKNWFYGELQKKLMKWAFLFLLIIILSDILHFSPKINAINQIYFILMFFLVLYLPRKKLFNSKLFNLFLALGLLQVIISYLQVNQYIPAPMKIMGATKNSSFLWIAGLNDVASGTFGAAASNVTSWFVTILFLFLFSFSIVLKNKLYAIIGFVFMLQYASVDSKTAIAVSILSFIYLLKRLKIFNLFKIRNIIYVFLISGFILLINNMLYSYYESKYRIGFDRPKETAERTIEIVVNNFSNWGKFAGFKNITLDYLKYNPAYLLIGYGRDKYNYEDNGGRIERMDTLLMSVNNITRSRSSLIQIYGQLGLPGLLMLLWLFQILKKDLYKTKFYTKIGIGFKNAAISILFGTLVFMFLYAGHTYMDQAFLTVFIFYAFILRIEKKLVKHNFSQQTVGKNV